MGEPFPEEVAPGGVLVYPSIHSPNYVAGTSGWTVNIDGSAEFNNLTLRGTFDGNDFILNSSGLFLYSGTPANGNLFLAIAPVAGTDSFGNPYNAGLSILSSAETITFGTNANPAFITANLAGIMALNSGLNNITDFDASLTLNKASGASNPFVRISTLVGSACDLYLNGIIYAAPGGSPETWHDMRPLTNSFVGTVSGEYPPQYRLSAEGFVEIFGTVQLPPSGSYNGIIFATLPSGYRPGSHAVSFPVVQLGGAPSTDASGGFPRIFIDTTGACSFNGLSSGINGTNVRVIGRFPLAVTGLIPS